MRFENPAARLLPIWSIVLKLNFNVITPFKLANQVYFLKNASQFDDALKLDFKILSLEEAHVWGWALSGHGLSCQISYPNL